MRTQGLKAFLAILRLNKTSSRRFSMERAVLVFSTAVTLGLIAVYVFEKATGRW